MGASKSIPKFPIDEHTAGVMSQYNIEERHVDKLYRKFVEYDEDDSKTWTLAEFNRFLHNYPDSLISPCLEALVKLASPTRDSQLGFVDFLISICSFCALSKEELLQFMYIVIDYDRSGVLDRAELFSFFSASVRMKPRKKHIQHQQIRKRFIYPPNYLKALEEYQGGKWKSLVFEEFCLMCDLFPHLAFPVFYLQEQLRRRVIGLSFWRGWDQERLKIFHLESESKSIKFQARSLATGELVNVVKPGRVTMKEVFEFTKRNGLKDLKMNASEAGAKNLTSFTIQRDAVLSRAPLLNLVRNPISIYYVPLHRTREDQQAEEEASAEETKTSPMGRGARRMGILNALDETDKY